jgi:hypothetical protein
LRASAGGLSVTGSALVVDSTISRNSADDGGGVFVADGTLDLRNSTVSGNTATTEGSATASGSAIYARNGTVTVRSGTIVASGPQDALTSTVTGSISLGGSVMMSSGPACSQPAVSFGWNVSSDASCGLTLPSDHQSVSALLAPLGDNGGPTLTHLPAASSPAVDVVPVGTLGLCEAGFTDQRGVSRPVGPACDVGSVER